MHRPSIKGTKLLFQTIKAIINQYFVSRSPDDCPLKNPIKIPLAHDAVAAALSQKFHLIIQVGTGPNCFAIELVMCELYLLRFDLTKSLSFDTCFRAHGASSKATKPCLTK